MSQSPYTLVFFDTNVLLHFKPVQQIDWEAVFMDAGIATTDLRFIVARVTLRELDKHKNEHRSPTIRQRAARVLKDLESAFVRGRQGAPTFVRQRFLLVVQSHDGDIDYDAVRLRRSSADDELIAAMLWHRAQSDECQLVLVSNDGGLRISALSHDIAVVDPGDDHRLPSEEDAITKELKLLRMENAALRHKEPRLSLCFAASEHREAADRIAVSIPPVPPEPVGEWEKARANAAALVPVEPAPPTPAIRKSRPNLDAATAAHVNQAFDFSLLSDPKVSEGFAALTQERDPEEIRRYARERVKYLADYDGSLRSSWEAWNKYRRSFLVQFLLRNDGSTPADDIEVQFDVPSGPLVELVSEIERKFALDAPRERPHIPDPPPPPAPPRTRLGALMHTPHVPFSPMVPYIPTFGPPAPRGLILRQANGTSGDEQFQRLKHGYSAQLAELRFWFPLGVAPRNFQIAYRITAENLASAEEGVLHVKVREAPDETDQRPDSPADDAPL